MIIKNYKNVVSSEILDTLIQFFETNTHLYKDTMGMLKISNPWQHVQEILDPLLSQYFDTSSNLGDNFYKHSFPYFPHIDSFGNKNSYNVLIPLKLSHPVNQKFIIFDQYCTDYSGATWLGNIWKPEGNFEANKKREFPYKDIDVVGCTDSPVDPDLYKDLHYDYRNEEMFFGLTGTAYDYTPGNILLFPSNSIHCTGKMDCDWKMGLSLRFEILDTTTLL
tara:strand:- start:2936 stop:3598 length:663 start_codon:yes stop_codon:yes gene_type:complete